MYRPLVKPTQEDYERYWTTHAQPMGLVDHHQSVVLTVFIDTGLIEVTSREHCHIAANFCAKIARSHQDLDIFSHIRRSYH
jgi:hypothetical protein